VSLRSRDVFKYSQSSEILTGRWFEILFLFGRFVLRKSGLIVCCMLKVQFTYRVDRVVQ
jgi:hypothetical protein